MNNIIETTGIIEFQNVFEQYTLSEYEYIYISIGSKFNQKIIEYPMAKQTIKKVSNAKWQMLPGFIRCKKTLSICIDRFENKEIKQENTRILKTEKEPNIEIIVCDIDGSIQLMEQMVRYITNSLNNQSISKNNVIIVNYIRFIHPNHTEIYLEEQLSSCIQKIVEKTPYNNCFYEWFGYQSNLYNIIYRYNNRIVYHIIYCIQNILQKKVIPIFIIIILNIYSILNFTKTNKKANHDIKR